MPQDIIDHSETDIDSLQGYFCARGTTFGERPALSVSRSKLMAANGDLQTTWSLIANTLAAAAMRQRPSGQEQADQFQVAIYHVTSVLPDGPPPRLLLAVLLPQRGHGRETRKGAILNAALPAPWGPHNLPPSLQKPPALTILLLSRTSQGLSPPTPVVPSSPGTGVREPQSAADAAGGGTRRASELIHIQNCVTMKAEDALDLQARQQEHHDVLEGMTV